MKNTTDKVTLYIATHNITGKKYFGKTTRYFTEEDLQENYHGSGTYWKKHLEKHGDDVTMEIYGIFNIEEVVKIALQFSKDNSIVESKKWTNLINENGLDGGSNNISIDTKQKISKSSKSHWDKKMGYKKEYTVNCFKCGINFIVIEREKQFPKKEKYFCSKFCACSRPATKEANEKRRISNKKYNLENDIKPKNSSKGTKYINKDNIIKRIKPEFLEEYLRNGWNLGKK